MHFEWDAAKAVFNLRKHGVSFEMAMRVFADPFALTDPSAFRTASNAGYLLLLVAHTVSEVNKDGQVIDIIRIVSARAADRKERRRYEQETR